MAVPKRKTSKARRDSRRAHWKALAGPTLVECPQCHEPKLPHRVCSSCGYYNRREVIEVE
ncbi:MAG: 50S ribosomal protein L32 [Actinomycetota bacterium]|nr:50S ribosomal protein L32 [Actinomycetota bacterium]